MHVLHDVLVWFARFCNPAFVKRNKDAAAGFFWPGLVFQVWRAAFSFFKKLSASAPKFSFESSCFVVIVPRAILLCKVLQPSVCETRCRCCSRIGLVRIGFSQAWRMAVSFSNFRILSTSRCFSFGAEIISEQMRGEIKDKMKSDQIE